MTEKMSRNKISKRVVPLELDVIKVNSWTAPAENGAPVLCMPNVPKPMHSLAPRVIEGTAKWNIMRTKCYMDADYTCEACGTYLGAGNGQAHELYSTDWEHQRLIFERCVCLCKMCHGLFIHSGRAYSLYLKGDPQCTATKMLKAAKHCFQVIADYNVTAKEPLRAYGALISWLKDPELGKWLAPMVEQYNIKFYSPEDAHEGSQDWGKWRLIYKGEEYEPKYQNAKEWEEALV